MKNSILIPAFLFSQILLAQKTLIPYKNGKLWGFANETGSVVIQPKYDSVTLFSHEAEKFAVVSENRKVGVIDQNGKEILPNIYKQINYVDENRMYKTRSKSFFAEKLNGTLELYSRGRKVAENLQVIKSVAGKFILVQKNSKLGLFDDDGSEVLPIVYNQIDYIKSEDHYSKSIKYRVSSDLETKYVILKVPEEKTYDQIYSGMTAIAPSREGFEEISKKQQLDIVKCVNGSTHCIFKSKNKFGYINLENNQRLKAEFDNLDIKSTFDKTYLIAKKGDKTALLDSSGAILLPYDNVDLLVRESYAEILKNGKEGLYFFNTKKIILPKYNTVKGYLYRDGVDIVNDIVLKRLYDSDSKDWFYAGSNGVVYKSE